MEDRIAMPGSPFTRPRLPAHLLVRVEPPDDAGDEALVFRSERRQVKLKGQLFREFLSEVVPLLDGEHTLAEIQDQVADVFAPGDVERSLQLLADHNLLEDAAAGVVSEATRAAIAPQLSFLHEVSGSPAAVQDRLGRASVAVLGLGGAGAIAALSLAAARVGTVRCIDAGRVSPADAYLASVYAGAEIGARRVDVLQRAAEALAPEVSVSTHAAPLESDDDVAAAVAGADFVVCCADQSMATLFYRLNRVCLQSGTPWTSCAVSALEGVVGPTVQPGETACFLCYTMRSVACTQHPEDEMAYRQLLDRRKRDDSAARENLAFGTGAVGNLVGLEALKALSGSMAPALLGRIAVLDFLNFTLEKHAVLRKPWCPACGSA
jgi:adenylyltransferase/sulfurtransferase